MMIHNIDLGNIKPTGSDSIYFTEKQLTNSLHLFEGLNVYTGSNIILGTISNIIYENGKLYANSDVKYYKLCLCWDIHFDNNGKACSKIPTGILAENISRI
jgi:hypothetical protein